MRYRTIFLIAAISVLVCGCSGGGGGGAGSKKKSSGSSDDGVIAVDLDTANPPWRIESSNDLALYSGHVHQDYFADPTHFAIYWSIRSSFTGNISAVEWVVQRVDGDEHETKTGTVTNLPGSEQGGDGHNYHVEWTETEPGRHYYVVMIDPDSKIDEASRANNSHVFVVDIPESSEVSRSGDIELYAREAHVHELYPGSGYIVHFEARNTTANTIGPTTWTITSPELGVDQTYTLARMEAGEVIADSDTIVITEPGLHELILTIDADDEVAESNENNNRRVFPLLIGPPQGSG
jgi:hypothetical protein